MAAKIWMVAPALVAVGAMTPRTPPPSTAETQVAAPAQAPATDASTLDDQTELSLTVYNSDLEMVRSLIVAGAKVDVK